MSVSLTFAEVLEYNTLKSGITVPVRLCSGEDEISFSAKLDTGASHCVFARQHGERLGLHIESEFAEHFSTATGSFLAYGHEVRIIVLGIEAVTRVWFAADETITRNVLGRNGWLDRVQLGLIDYEGKLFLSYYDATTE